MEIHYSTGKHARDAWPKPAVCRSFPRFSYTLEDLRRAIGITPEDTLAQMRAKKARLPYIWHSLKNISGGRNALNAGARDVLFLDMDGCDEAAWQALREALACFSCFTYSTPSHLHPTANGEQRWRICLELDRPVTPEEYKRLGPAVDRWLMDCINLLDDYAVKWDQSVYNPDHVVYGPDENATFERFAGSPVTVDILLASAPEITSPEKAPSIDHDDLTRITDIDHISQQTLDDLRTVLMHPDVLADAEPGCGKYPLWVNTGNRLAWFKGTDWEDAARQLWMDWSVAGGGDGQSAEHKWDNDLLTADRTGYQAIFARAQTLGVANPATSRPKSAVASPDDFDDVTPDVKSPPLPPFERDNRGRIEATIENAVRAVERPDFTGMEIRFDKFRDETMFAQEGTGQWQPFTDEDYVRLRISLACRGFRPVGRDLIRDAVSLVADEHQFDSAITWLKSLEWDGVPRIEMFFHTHFGTPDTPYTRAVSMYMWTALAGRVLVPAVKADMVPVLVGPQGCGKSSGVAALSPDPAFFTELSFAEKDADLSRKMRGRLVAEFSELNGLNSREREAIKAFVTRTHENWVPKFREFATQFPRRLVIIGTTNEDTFLNDTTGNRRWLPVNVSEIQVQDVEKDRDLLWAEAREVFVRLGGIQFAEAERLGAEVHEQYMIKDPWQEIVEAWLGTPDMLTNDIPRDRKHLRITDVLKDALGLKNERIGRREELRAGKVLRNCGYRKVERKVDGKTRKVWEPENPL